MDGPGSVVIAYDPGYLACRPNRGRTTMDMGFGTDIDRARLAAVCRRYGITALLVFGSAARGTATAGSDLDLLYELAPGVQIGWEIEDLADELADVLGRPVDLVSRIALHPLLATSVLDEARPLYAA